MNTKEFRQEIVKIMPGYNWAVKKPYRLKTETAPGFAHMEAVGTQSRGFNRMSTLQIKRRVGDNGDIEYEANVAGYGTRGPWTGTRKGKTLARTLRGLQEYCEAKLAEYAACVNAMEGARAKKGGSAA